ncbi:hypothetical protein RCL1_003222 [Eukaryota sp. TZLM3-RCL]
MLDFDFSKSDQHSALLFAAFFEELTRTLVSLGDYVKECIVNQSFRTLPTLDIIGLTLTRPSCQSLRTIMGVFQDKKVYVKFNEMNYSIQLQNLLSDHNLAQKILHCLSFAQWKIIIMEYVHPVDELNSEVVLLYKPDLQRLQQLLTENKFVHGDLHPSNLMLTKNGLKIIDFD